MVYGRYNELDNYGIHGVYKPTYNWWFMIDITYIWYNELVNGDYFLVY